MGTGRSFASEGKASVNLSFHAIAVVGTVRSGVPTVGLVQLKHAQGRKDIQAPTAQRCHGVAFHPDKCFRKSE